MDYIKDPSLVLDLPLYLLDGANIKSKDAYGHLCTVTGATWREQGRTFVGSPDLISPPYPAALDLTNTYVYTIEAWIKPTNTAIRTAFSWGNTANDNPLIQIYYDTNTLYFFVRDTAGTTVSIGYVTGINQWYHAVGVGKADNSWEFFVNGVSRGTSTTTVGAIALNNIRIGALERTSIVQYWIGNVGEVRVYNRALNPLETLTNFIATKKRY